MPPNSWINNNCSVSVGSKIYSFGDKASSSDFSYIIMYDTEIVSKTYEELSSNFERIQMELLMALLVVKYIFWAVVILMILRLLQML